ncbi:NAD(P)/FAD-dependent oxidoreductase [Solimonas marina]|uniref:NAD(P)/FAD-dependent oxidoreductase n=1 Tax=Solimonas marina TaxID=2714601 RepID=A0A969W9M9_9GAMM|nr:NAD(P)/FAD-dependent oxidoreductase [Solimonas marina]NKF22023.1 NAD(P)/FAD-dependent oxidoreductase [Solimonas marina]
MQHDALIIGGSFAGLSAAMYIARARRHVCVVDSGEPRNRYAAHSHGFFAQDGSTPAAMLDTARRQVAAYPTVSLRRGRALEATRTTDGFAVTLDDGVTLKAARLVLAFGLRDELPAIPGLAERWGHSVIHCPYCHGYEFSGRRLGVLNVAPHSIHHALLVTEWGPVTFFLNGGPMPDDETLAALKQRKVTIETTAVHALHGAGQTLQAVELGDGRRLSIDALYVGPKTHANSDIAERLGCEIDDGVIRTDAQMATTVPGVFAAGDITRKAHSVTWASADGVTAGCAVHRSLVF